MKDVSTFNRKLVLENLTITEWNPGYYDKWGVFHPYEKKWFCNFHKLIHQSEKEKNNCQHCKKL
jgi:hypothetical protein